MVNSANNGMTIAKNNLGNNINNGMDILNGINNTKNGNTGMSRLMGLAKTVGAIMSFM